MALTLTSNLTTIDTCDTTGWTLTDGTTNYGDLDDVAYTQGSGCLAVQVKATTGSIGVYTMASSIDMTDGGHVYQWMMVAGTADTKANGGYRMYLEDTAGNNATWYVGGSDTAQGWTCFVLDPQSTPDIVSGTLDLTAIIRVGIQLKTLTTAAGQADNVFWDVVRYGTGLTATSLSTDLITVEDLYLVDSDVNNRYGVIQKLNGVYFIKGKVHYGNTLGDEINAEINQALMVYTEDGVSSTFFDLALSGSTGAVSNLSISGSVLKCAGQKALLDFTGVDSITSISGSTIDNMDIITPLSTSSLTGSVFSSCNAIYPNNSVFNNNTISNTTEAILGSIVINNNTMTSNMNTLSLNEYSTNLRNAIYISADLVDGDSITLDSYIFDDPTSTYCVYWAGTSGTLTVNRGGNTNMTTTAWSSAGGTIFIPAASYTFTFTISPTITDYEYRIYSVDAVGSLTGAVELQGLEVAALSSYDYTYEYSTDFVIAVQILPHLNDYEEVIQYYTLSNSNQSVNISLTNDINN